MAKKKKSKLKRFLKKAAPLVAAGLGAAALSRRGRNLGVSGADKRLFTSDRAYTGGGYHDPIMTGGVGVKPSRLPTWTGDQTMTNRDPFNYYKKGGRVKGAGKAKRGLGRAFTNKKK
jgi:hypothetical protein